MPITQVTTVYSAFTAASTPVDTSYGKLTLAPGSDEQSLILRPFSDTQTSNVVEFQNAAGLSVLWSINKVGAHNFLLLQAIADVSGSGKFFLSSTTANTLKYYDVQGTPVLHTLATLEDAQTISGVKTFSATQAFTNASPFSVANAQTLTISTTSQTVGAATLTIPNFASVSDTFAFITLAQTLVNKTLTSPTINGATISGTFGGIATFSGANTFSSTQAFTNASPFSVANGQTLTISVTAQTVGASTLTVPNFASAADTFAFITLAQTLSNKTLASPVVSGTITGVYTIGGTPTLGSSLNVNAQNLNNAANILGNPGNNTYIATQGALDVIRLATRNAGADVERLRIQTNAAQGSAGITSYESINPGSDNALVFGSSSLRWFNLHLSNQVNVWATAGDANPTARLLGGAIQFGAGGATSLDQAIGRDSVNATRIYPLSGVSQDLLLYATTDLTVNYQRLRINFGAGSQLLMGQEIAGTSVLVPWIFKQGATEVFRITTNPYLQSSVSIGLGGVPSSANVLEFRAAATIAGTQVQIGATGDGGVLQFNVASTKTFDFLINAVAKCRLDSSGNIVFLGGIAPTGANVAVGSDGTNIWLNVSTGNNLVFGVNGVNKFQLNATSCVKFGGVPTAGLGLSAIFGVDNRSGLTAADGAATTIVASTASGAVYRITADIFATAYTSGTATYTVTWTENSGTRTLVVTAAALNTLGTATDLIQPDAATAITVQLTGAFTATVKVAGVAEQLA